MFNPFSRAPRGGAAWFNAGPVSSYPDNTGADGPLAQQRRCEERIEPQPGEQIQTGSKETSSVRCKEMFRPGCRVFHVPREDAALAREVVIDEWKEEGVGDAKDQVMVFRFAGRVVAVNHECPHSSYPLSNGTPFDIEDFGVKLSAGITCPKHAWSFDLHTGRSDRGSYKLQVWETQLRTSAAGEEEVWVRRKARIG